MTVIATGKSSFLAQAVQAAQPAGWVFLSHGEALTDKAPLTKASCIVNFAFSPALRAGEYSAAEDIDSQLAVAGVPYVMLSTRMAYGPAAGDGVLREGQAENPATAYGRNKLAVERALQSKLGDKLTVLRLGNIFGPERGRATFFGLALAGLHDRKTVTLDMDPAQPRDFLSSARFAQALIKIAAAPKPGLFNLGSGIGTPCGDIATWLIEGYGEGAVKVNDSGKNDAFTLDMAKTSKAFGLAPVTRDDIRQDVVACGRQSRAAA